MSTYEAIEAIERRRTLVRTILFLVILGTLPLYLLGFWWWGTAPDPDASGAVVEETLAATNTPIGSDPTATLNLLPSATPRPSSTASGPLNPTPYQFFPPAPVVQPTQPPFVLPTSTNAPTLTPIPTWTPIPTATDPPPPTNTPPATSTPFLPPTDTPAPVNNGPETTEEV